MGGWLHRPGYFKGGEHFPMELGFFEKLRIFRWGFEAILVWLKLLRGVMFFSFSCRLGFSFFLMAGRGEADIFPEAFSWD